MGLVPHTRGSLATLTLALLALLGLISLASAQQPESSQAPGTYGRLAQPRGEDGCIHRTGVNRCADGRFITSPEDVAVSPDGRYVYVASYGNHAIDVFRRNRRTGTLTQLPRRRGCIHHQPADPGRGACARARALGGPVAIAISPNGRNMYVAAAGSDALSVFARSTRTGGLRQLAGGAGCFSQRTGGGCTAARALNEPTSVAVSPDGDRVYVAGRRFPSAVAIFTRAADGTLSQAGGPAGCVSHRGGSDCTPARGLASPEEVAVTPDSRHVLVASMRSNGVAVLSAGPDGLSQPEGEAGCIARGGRDEECAPARQIAGPVDLAISRDGRFVYAAGSIADAVAVLRRDRASGALTQSAGRRGCISQGGARGRCAVGRALDEVWGIALSPDGRNLYAVSAKINTLSVMARSPETGSLAQLRGRLGCFIRAGGFGCREGRGLTVAVATTVSPDGRNVYVASEDIYLGSVAVFRRRAR